MTFDVTGNDVVAFGYARCVLRSQQPPTNCGSVIRFLTPISATGTDCCGWKLFGADSCEFSCWVAIDPREGSRTNKCTANCPAVIRYPFSSSVRTALYGEFYRDVYSNLVSSYRAECMLELEAQSLTNGVSA